MDDETYDCPECDMPMCEVCSECHVCDAEEWDEED